MGIKREPVSEDAVVSDYPPCIATKEFTFDCAHMLTGHNGLCRNLHGHTYRLLISVAGRRISTGSAAGMVVDFRDLKSFVQTGVVDTFDHAYVYNAQAEGAEREIAKVCEAAGLKTVCMERVTAENMARYIFKVLDRALAGASCKLWKVRLYETPTSYAEVTVDGIPGC